MGELEKLERHYSPEEIAAAWHMSIDTVRRLFRTAPGVLNFGSPKKRVLRIPESVYRQVYEQKVRKSA